MAQASAQHTHVPLAGVDLARLAACVARLDPGTRALLDLSVRRGVRDDQMAPILQADPFHLAWRRARALDQLASEVVDDGEAPAPLGEVRMALEALPRQAWGLPVVAQPALPAPGPAVGSALVPAEPPGRLARLDSFALESPRLRDAFGDLGRAVAAKLVRLVVWRRR
jgi:hypothetical protein